MKRILIILAALIMLQTPLWAQGELGFGESEDQTLSLMERVSNIERKFKEFNVYVNFAGNVHLQQDASGADFHSGFQARQLRLEMKGQLGDHFYYRLRHRLNRPNVALEDNLAKATDIIMLGYRFNPQWLISVGKMGTYTAGFEFDQNGIYVYQGSDINNYSDGSKVGAAITWTPVKGHNFVLQLVNTYNDKFEKEFVGIEQQGILASNHPLAVAGYWNGSMLNGIWKASASCLRRQLAEGKGSVLTVVGNSINGNWGRVFLDYAYEHDDLDYMRFVSNEVPTFSNGQPTYLSYLSYHGLVMRGDIKVGKHLILWAEGMYQTASCGSVRELDGYRKHYNYMAGLEFVPDPDYKIRYTLNYQGQYYDYSDLCGLKDRSVNRIEVGILCRLKCF